MCLDDIQLGLGGRVATFWGRAAHLINYIFPLLCLFVSLVVSHLGFEGGNLVPGHRFPFNFQ